MEILTNIPNGKYKYLGQKQIVMANLDEKMKMIGKSVNSVLLHNKKYWFPIRATYHRAQKIYNLLVALGDDSIEPYLPMLRHIEYSSNSDFNNPTCSLIDKPLDKGLLFLRCTHTRFRELLNTSIQSSGMTPYYNHFNVNEYGTNDYLTIPDRQFMSFKIIVESGNKNIIVDQNDIPPLIVGDRVVVIGGPFAGVEGVVMKYKHQKRVFVELDGVGRYATAFVTGAWLKKIT